MKLFSNFTGRSAGRSTTFFLFATVMLTASAKATTYSAVNDFSIAGNPNGNWSYLYSGTLLGTELHGTTGNLAGLDLWSTGKPIPNAVTVGKNLTNGPLTVSGTIVVPTNYLLLDPESYSNVDVKFTASAAGTYSITGGFLGIDTGEHSHPVEILDNGVVVFSSTISSYGQSDPFSFSESLKVGDVLNFESLTGSTYTNLSTGLAVTIAPTASPEPASGWYMTLVGGGLILWGRRKTSKSAE